MMARTAKVLPVSLEERWKTYRAQLKACRHEFSEEAVHDLRVATRRLLALLDIARALDPHPRIQKARKEVKRQLDALDELRDVQVMLVEAVEALESMPELRSFVAYLHKQEKILLRTARRQTKESQPKAFVNRIEKIQLVLNKYSNNKETTARLLEVVDQVYSKAAQAYSQLDALQPATIHGLRIAILDIWPKLLPFQREALWLEWGVFIPVYSLTIFILISHALTAV